MSLLERYDVSIDVHRKSRDRNTDLCCDYRFGETQHYNLPFRNTPPEVPNNYIDFMKLYYVKLNQDKVDEIILFNERLNYNNLKSLSYKFGGKGYDDFLLSRIGLKYFVFYRYHGYDDLKGNFFVNHEYPAKEYKRSAENIENMLLDLQYRIETGKDSLGTHLIEDSNSIVKNLLIESLKMEEIMDNYNNNSYLSYANCNHNSTGEVMNQNNNNEQTPYFGCKDSIYKSLMDILARIEYSLQYPKVPEGIVTYDHLMSEIAKYKGVSRQELDVILASYTTTTDLALKLANYLGKDENDAVIKTLATKIEFEDYVKSQEEKLSKIYTKEEVDGIVENLVSEDRLDVRLERYLAIDALNEIVTNYMSVEDGKKVFALKESITVLEEKIKALGEKGYDDTEIQAAVAEVKNNITDLQTRVAALETSKDSLSARVDELVTANTEKDTKITQLEADVAGLKKVLGDVKGIKIVSKNEAASLVPEDGVLYLFEK